MRYHRCRRAGQHTPDCAKGIPTVVPFIVRGIRACSCHIQAEQLKLWQRSFVVRTFLLLFLIYMCSFPVQQPGMDRWEQHRSFGGTYCDTQGRLPSQTSRSVAHFDLSVRRRHLPTAPPLPSKTSNIICDFYAPPPGPWEYMTKYSSDIFRQDTGGALLFTAASFPRASSTDLPQT